MSVTLTIYDETLTGERAPRLTLALVEPQIKARELLRHRVYQEAHHYNQSQPEYFKGLVQPNDSEQTLNGYKLSKQRSIDPEQQYQKALEVFERSGFMILVNDREVENLDAEIELSDVPAISFLRTYLKVGPRDERAHSKQSAKKAEPFTHFLLGLSPLLKAFSRSPFRPRGWTDTILDR
jgi:hypothetical protein